MTMTTPTPTPARPVPKPVASIGWVTLAALEKMLMTCDRIETVQDRILESLTQIGEKLMPFLDNLASLATILPELQNDQAAILAQLQSLQTQLTNAGIPPAQLAQLDGIVTGFQAVHDAFVAAANPVPTPTPTPTPTPAPAPTPTTG